MVLAFLLAACRGETKSSESGAAPAVLRPASPPADLITSILDSSNVSYSGIRIPRESVFEWRLPEGPAGNLRFSWRVLDAQTGTVNVELIRRSAEPRIIPLMQTSGAVTISHGDVPLQAGEVSAVRFSSPEGAVILSDLRLVQPSKGNAALVFVLVDTLRRDAVGLYGSRNPATPRIDRFFATAWRAERAYAPASWTTPSVAALFTGEPNHVLGDDPADPIGGQRTLATAFRSAGWSTAGFIANPTLNRDNGFDTGFTAFYTAPYDPASMRIPADQTLAKLKPWLDAHAGERFFLYVHLIDPHEPYAAPDRPRGVTPFDPSYRGSFHGEESFAELTFDRQPSPADIAHLRALYDDEVRYADSAVGDFLEQLPEELRERATFILTSDHGEEFFEHRGWKHGPSLYDEVLRIPLLIRHPGGEKIRIRPDQLVSLIDLFPTLCNLFNLPDREHRVTGTNLLEASDRSSLPAVGMTTGGAARVALVGSERKLLFFDRWGTRGIPDAATDPLGNGLGMHLRDILPALAAFDLAQDPLEQRPLDPTAAERVAAWRSIETAVAPKRKGVEIRIIGGAQPATMSFRIHSGGLRAAEGFALEQNDKVKLRGGVADLNLVVTPGDVDGVLMNAEENPPVLTVQKSDVCVRMIATNRVLTPDVSTELTTAEIGNSIPRFEPQDQCAGVVIWRAEGATRKDTAPSEDEVRKKLRALGYIH